jgi:hypothetical protein
MNADRRPIKPLVFRILWIAAGVAFLTKIITVGLAMAHHRLPVPMIVLLLLIITIPVVVARNVDLTRATSTVLAEPTASGVLPDADDAVRTAIDGWYLHLVSAPDYPQAVAYLRAQFIGLVVERLRLGHDIDPKTRPDRARQLVGPRVWALLTDPSAPLGVKDIPPLLSEMEAL